MADVEFVAVCKGKCAKHIVFDCFNDVQFYHRNVLIRCGMKIEDTSKISSTLSMSSWSWTEPITGTMSMLGCLSFFRQQVLG